MDSNQPAGKLFRWIDYRREERDEKYQEIRYDTRHSRTWQGEGQRITDEGPGYRNQDESGDDQRLTWRENP